MDADPFLGEDEGLWPHLNVVKEKRNAEKVILNMKLVALKSRFPKQVFTWLWTLK